MTHRIPVIMKSQWFLRLCVAALLLLVTSVTASAQLSTGIILGSVTDQSGSLVAGASITLTQTDTNFERTAISRADGTFREDFLPVGPYRIKVTAPGFKNYDRTGIVLAVMQTITLNVPLAIGEQVETVSITEEAPLIDASSSTLGQQVDTQQIGELPLVNRNVERLLQLIPGVQSVSTVNNLGYNEIKVLANGSTDGFVGQVSYYLDGGLNMTGLRNSGNQVPNPDAVSQFNVVTNDYSAQLGRYSGAVVSVLTKSGTNKFHGSVFEFNRERNFNAGGFNTGGASKTPYNQHRFGANVGGPVRKDKDFFYVSYGGFRYITYGDYSGSLPSDAQMKGDFSENLPTAADAVKTGEVVQTACNQLPSASANTNVHFLVCDPVTFKPYANNKLPQVDPTAVNIIKYIKANLPVQQPFRAGDTPYTYRTRSPLPQSNDEYLFKTDHQLTPSHRLSLSYFLLNSSQRVSLGGFTQAWSSSDYTNRQQNANASDVWTVSPRSINQLWLSYTRQYGGRIATPASTLADFGSDLGVVGTPSRSNISVGGVEGFTLAQAITGPKAGANVYGIRDIFSTSRGKHTLNLGGEAGLEKDFQLTSLNNYGTFTFSSSTSARTSNALSDFVAGVPASMGQDTGLYANANYFNYGIFLQDDWHLLRNLTVNLGARYDWQQAPTDPQRMQTNFTPGVQSHAFANVSVIGRNTNLAPLGMLFPGDPGVPNGGVFTPNNHFSPRLGFAWDTFSNGRTVVHGGAGLFFGGISGNEWEFPSNYAPYAVRNSYSKVTSLTHPYANDPTEFPSGTNPYPSLVFNYASKTATFLPLNSVVAFDPNYRWPYSIQLNFGIQQQITRNMALVINYVGALNRKTPLYNDINGPQFNVTAAGTSGASCTDLTKNCAYANTSSTVNNRRPLNQMYGASAASPMYGNVWIIRSNQNSNYNGLQLTVEERFSHHFSARGYYSWSKTLQSNALDSTSGLNGTFVDANYPALEYRQRSDQDRRHMMTMSFVWKPDYFDKSNRYLRYALNGWSVNGIWTANSGQPFTVTTGNDNYYSGLGNNRPSILPGTTPHITRGSRSDEMLNWFDKTVYCRPGVDAGCSAYGFGPLGLLGNERPAMLNVPGYRNVDASLSREFHAWQQTRLQLRCEASNVFNLVNLGGPTASMNSANFGKITGSGGGARILQISARLAF